MPPRARLEQEREGRIARDVDPVDRVHLDGDVQGHRKPLREARRNPIPAVARGEGLSTSSSPDQGVRGKPGFFPDVRTWLFNRSLTISGKKEWERTNKMKLYVAI